MAYQIVFNPFTGKFQFVTPAGGGGGTTIHSGHAVVDFGSTPGNSDATTVITGQTGIISGSIIQAWLSPGYPTVDHSIEEHVVEEVFIDAGSTVPGVGFTIYAVTRNVALTGKWNVSWSWY